MSLSARNFPKLTMLGCLAPLLALACADEAPPPDLPPRAIQWQAVSTALADERLVISGIVTSIADTVLAFEVGGTVKSVDVNLGARVEKGAILARLDSERFELAVRDAEAALAEARALQEAARADYERVASLFESNVRSRQEYDQAAAARGSRDSRVDAAAARLGVVRRDLRRSTLRAPFAGVISVRNVEPAMKMASGQAAFEMDSKDSGLRVEVQIPETRIADVRQGDDVEVRFPAIGKRGQDLDDGSFMASVSEVGTRAGTGNAFPVRADILAPPAGLRPGMTAEVTFEIRRAADLEGFMIPVASTRAESGDTFSVFVFDRATSRVNKRPIRTGGIRYNDIAVLEGLSDGDVIATAGVSFLRDGERVTLLSESFGAMPR